MSRYIQGENVNQINLIPMCFDDMILQDNPVRAISTIVEYMDINSMGFDHAETKTTGRKPYSPVDMFKLYAYSYYNGVRSSRKIERECRRNIELMWLIGNLTPDFKTIADFRKNNSEAIQKAFYRFGAICGELGLVGKEIVAIDGSKFRANNARGSWFNKKKVQKQLEYYHNSADKYMRLLEACDCEESEKTETSVNPRMIEEKLSFIRSQIEKLKKIELLVQEKGEISITDPDSRLMKMNNGGCGVCHNVQIAVDSKEHIVVAVDVASEAGDKEQLSHMSKLTKEKLDIEVLTVLADKGYYTASEFASCMENDIVPIVSKAKNEKSAPSKEYSKTKFTYLPEQDAYVCPLGNLLLNKIRKPSSKTPGMRYSNPKACKDCPKKLLCTLDKYRCIFDQPFQRYADEVDKITRENMQLYRKRQEIVEHPFGSVKRALGFTHFLSIGAKNVRTESVLHFLAYNLKRTINTVGVQKLIEVL